MQNNYLFLYIHICKVIIKYMYLYCVFREKCILFKLVLNAYFYIRLVQYENRLLDYA